ncbi:MAG TPA: Fe-S protein assembly chaperone HscA [Chitinophagaceae bacterium]|nr:Fe-S protein assembly chaperone HscA [Chitinophagaceae bacterium]
MRLPCSFLFSQIVTLAVDYLSDSLENRMAKIGINIATGSLQKQEMIVGIDLGTTNSLVAIFHPGDRRPVVLKEHDGNALVPSVIHFAEGGNLAIGDAAKNWLVNDPYNTIFSVKRLMGKTYNDVRADSSYFTYKVIDDNTGNLVKIQAGNKFFSPVELSSFILKELKSRAEHILKTAVNKAVITVPAYFNDSQRQATRDAGRLAGLDVLRIINEPTAASLAYGLGLDKNESKTIAVYDFGGGTFDISILKIRDGIFEVLSTNGDTYLGGDDLDRAIVKFWAKQLTITDENLQQDKQLAQELRLCAETAKKQLGVNDTFKGMVRGKEVNLGLEKFEELAGPIIQRTIQCCKNALRDAQLTMKDIDEVLMVGGSTRIPLVKSKIASFFGKEVHDSLNPDEVVALGAAIQADTLAGNNKEYLLLDITPLSLGIEKMGGLMDVLIPRNTRIPSKATRQYTTQKDGQNGIRISVFQGERDLVRDNRKLAEFSLIDIPAMPAGLPRVEITFLVNADGIMIVQAKELRSGLQQSVEVKPQYGLTDAEVERMLQDSIRHAKEDIQTRALVEAMTEAGLLMDTTRQFMQKNLSFLSGDESKATLDAITRLEEAITLKDKDQIQAGIESLNEISRPYAERLMDQSIKQAIRGKNINESF